ncbi:MAG: hypothetical protein A2V96_01890 [Candidatus Yonathbacteria bacterium RBG_16_43_6]|uniref:DUF1653 domain-containing protein n=1 Tax=Candidatus Yonathbacteria bacterium RIFCSPLOWO2_01_FULL_43_27 TaxID=1802726 RepID=A0A1G2SCG3_9BACT|nr:MAG: hypothetical protein A2658_01720 [Candidatus Yonathbacteria bacterium RIFCSPHIGHO2_01_FULL_44_19]OHA79242.1 MAG: hypothetical protein A2V96_01890 [Candidatus Yonathbacteria bacterium RBG_16_43_6]OHA82684.1 MAG: hypothetical protein A3B07_01925 [Candidatus Yonathbacteria bacterium RIFCSPLOWO2_01_FULL_43_27]
MQKEHIKKPTDIQKGLYEHYKNGKRYEVLDVVLHSETLEEMVVYRALYDEKITWVRPRAMFFEEVEKEGKKVSRFVYVG